MPNQTPPSPVFPVTDRFVNIAKEATAGTASTGTYVTIPVAGFEPDPKQQMLEDKGLRGAMTSIFDLEPGPYWTETTIPASPLFGDTIGHVLLNVFGDYTVTGTASTPTWTTSSALTPGAGPIPVTSATSAVAGTFIQISTGLTSEIVTVGTGSTATSIVISAATPIRFAHTTAATITTVIAPFTHVFNVLNPASSTGNVGSQPATHTVIDRNQVAGSSGFYADVYPYSCFSSVKLTGAATGLLTWEGSFTSWAQQPPASTAPTANVSSVKVIPAWRGASTVGGTSIFDIAQWEITLARHLEPVPTVDGQQAPFVIARGPLDPTFSLMYDPALDESALNLYLANTQPTLLWTTTNGGTGASLVSFSVAAQLGGMNAGKLNASKTLFGYDMSGICIGNTTNTGNSLGYGPCTVTLINAVPSY